MKKTIIIFMFVVLLLSNVIVTGQTKIPQLVVKKDGAQEVIDSNGAPVASIPKNVEVTFKGKNSKDINLINKNDKTVEVIYRRGNVDIKIKIEKGSRASVSIPSSSDSLTAMTLDKGSITIGKIELNDIRGALIMVDNKNNEINYARFKAARKATYKLNYEGDSYVFTTKPNSKIEFDPLSKSIEVENVEMTFFSRKMKGNFKVDFLKNKCSSSSVCSYFMISKIKFKNGGEYTNQEGSGLKFSKNTNLFFKKEGCLDLKESCVEIDEKTKFFSIISVKDDNLILNMNNKDSIEVLNVKTMNGGGIFTFKTSEGDTLVFSEDGVKTKIQNGMSNFPLVGYEFLNKKGERCYQFLGEQSTQRCGEEISRIGRLNSDEIFKEFQLMVKNKGIGNLYGSKSKYAMGIDHGLNHEQALAFVKIVGSKGYYTKKMINDVKNNKNIPKSNSKPPPVRIDCTQLVHKTLSKTYEEAGKENEFKMIMKRALSLSKKSEIAKKTGKTGLNGVSLGTSLIEAGWKAIFVGPQPNNPSDGSSEHPIALRRVLNDGTYYNLPVCDTVINYRPTKHVNRGPNMGVVRNPIKTTLSERKKLLELNNIQFGIHIARGGKHTAIKVGSDVLEAHWKSGPEDKKLLTKKNFEKDWDWESGVVLVPPGEWNNCDLIPTS